MTRFPTWRLLPDRSDSAALNMAVDLTLASGHAGRPLIRFYGWRRQAVSLGFRQPLADLNLDTCRQLGYELVRRPTGGSAVVHGSDLTYAVILPRDALKTNRPTDHYHLVHTAFARGLRSLGLDATASPRQSRQPSGPAASSASLPACFAALCNDEVSVSGFKVIGSAQRRFAHAILLQGSILLRTDAQAYERLLAPTDQPSPSTYLRGIETLSGTPIDRMAVRQALLDGLREELGVNFEEEPLDADEERAAREMAKQRFHTHEWTARH